MKELVYGIFTLFFVVMGAGLLIIMVENSAHSEAVQVEETKILQRDPKYDMLITSDKPMIVNQTKLGDDAVSSVHFTYYNPVTEEYYYEIYRGN